MSQTSIPWNGTVTGDAGPYSDDNWSDMWATLLGYDADEANASVIRAIEDELRVVATSPVSNQIEVSSGSALVQGKYYRNTAALAFTISANVSGNPRIDLVVLRVDYAAQTVRPAVKEGTPAGVPTIPALTQVVGTTWEVPLAYIAVANGFATLSQSDITDNRQYANIPDRLYQSITNNSAQVLEHGNVVVQDSTASDLNVDVTTTEGDETGCGIIESRTLVSGTGRMVTRGVIDVEVDGAVALGDELGTSTTAGQATANPDGAAFGIALETAAGAGELVNAWVDFSPLLMRLNGLKSSDALLHTLAAGTHIVPHFEYKLHVNAADYTTAGAAFADVDAANAIVTITTTGGNVLIFASCVMSSNTPGSIIGLDIYDVTNAARLSTTQRGLIYKHQDTANYQTPFCCFGIATGLAAGAHSFKLQWYYAGAGLLTLYNTVITSPIMMYAMEI